MVPVPDEFVDEDVLKTDGVDDEEFCEFVREEAVEGDGLGGLGELVLEEEAGVEGDEFALGGCEEDEIVILDGELVEGFVEV